MKPWIYALLITLSAPAILRAQADGATSPFQLADPVVAVDSQLFRHEAKLRAQLDYFGTVLRYTRDGSDPTPAAPRLPPALRVTDSGTIKIRAFHPELRPSEVVAVSLVRVGPQPKIESVKFVAAPHPTYPGEGAASLFDLQKGGSNFRQAAWSGFAGTDATVELTFATPQSLDSVGVSTLSNVDAWIFPPAGIFVYGGTAPDAMELLGEATFPPLSAAEPAALLFRSVACKARPVTYLRIVVHHAGAIPDWHPGAGTPAWLFLDEVLLVR